MAKSDPDRQYKIMKTILTDAGKDLLTSSLKYPFIKKNGKTYFRFDQISVDPPNVYFQWKGVKIAAINEPKVPDFVNFATINITGIIGILEVHIE